MTKAQKETELERVIDKCRSPKISEFLNWLGRQAIEKPHHRADWREVFTSVIDRDVKPEQLNAKDETTVKNIASRTRKHINDFYSSEALKDDIWLDLPIDLAAMEKVGKRGRYGVRFGVGPRPVREEQRRIAKLKLRPAAELLDAMIHSQKPRHSLLIFPADPIKKRRGREWYTDDRGLETGSGEVVGAFLIGECLAHLRGTFEIRKSCDVNVSELEVPSSCFFYLGSSMKCGILKGLRERQPWKDLQSFHFHVADKMHGEEGSIWEGKFGVGRPKRVYNYKVKTLRDHEIDYALVSFFQDYKHHQSIIAIQGISTIATWGGALFMTSDERSKELRKELNTRFNIGPDDPLPSFELLLQVTLRNYRPEEIKIRDLKIH